MKKYIILLATVTLLSNCASYKPDSRGVGQRDYNGRISVSSPHYKVKPSLASYTGMLAFAAAGGYATYQYGNGIVTYYDKGERKNIKEADAAIGALTSFSIAYLTNKLLFKTNTTKEADDYKKWMKKAKLTKDYNFLRGYSDTDLMVIDKSYERNYTVRNYADVLDFEKAFPNSIQTDRVLKDAIKVVKRNELGSLIYKYPNSAYIKDMKYHYIDTSPSLMDFYKTSYRYNDVSFPNKKDKIKGFLWTTTKGDLADVISKYPKDQYVAVLKNSYIDKSKDLLAFYNALNKYSDFKYPNKKQKMSSYLPQSSKTMLSFVVGKYPNDEYVSILKTSYIEKSRSVSDLFEAKERYPSVKYNYDERALELLTNLDELSLFEEKVGSSEIVTKGKTKIDNMLWEEALQKHTFADYGMYIALAPLKLHHKEASDRMKKIQSDLKAELIEMIQNDDISGLYNFYLKHKDAKDSFSTDLANIAYKGSMAINNANVDGFNKAVAYDEASSSLVKIILSSNDERPLFPEKKKIINFLDARYSQFYHLFTWFGASADQDKLFPTIYEPQFYNKFVVINALWYRRGTDKDGAWLKQNTGFKAFRGKMSDFARSNNLKVEYLEYLGSYSDDNARYEARRIAQENYKQEQCNNCIVNYKKTKTPDNEGFFQSDGIIEMKNGDNYSWNYTSRGYKVINCFFCSSDYYKSYHEMLNSLEKRCREERACD